MTSNIKGKNTLKARELFLNRFDYKVAAFAPRQLLGYPSALAPAGTADFWWAERAFLGRVSFDDVLEPVEAYVPFMKSLRTKKTSTLVLNFVADAFKDFQEEYLLQIRLGRLEDDDPLLTDIEAARGYSSVRDAYRSLQRDLYASFSEYLKTNNIIDKILDIEDFISEMTYYLLNIYDGPFTRSAFVLSRHVGPMSSGLCIDTQLLSYSEDEPKIKFINSPNFKKFLRIANQHGFLIDKNIPWRLVADIRSPKMIEYAKQYDSEVDSPQSIVNKFFVQTAIDEIENLKLYLVSLYNQFVSDNPRVLQEDYHASVTDRVIYARSPISLQKLNECYSDCRWLDLYIRVRNKETGLNYSVPAEKAIIRVAKDIQKTLDTREAMSYIKIKFSGVEFYEGSLFHTTERRRQARHGKDKMSPEEAIRARARGIRKVFY